MDAKREDKNHVAMGHSPYHCKRTLYELLKAYRSHWYYQGQLKHGKILHKLEDILVEMHDELKLLKILVENDNNAEMRNGIVTVFIALINFWVETTVFLRKSPLGKYWRLLPNELANGPMIYRTRAFERVVCSGQEFQISNRRDTQSYKARRECFADKSA